MKIGKLLCCVVLCAGLSSVIAGGALFYARRNTAYHQAQIREKDTYRLSAFTEIRNRDRLTLCARRGLCAALPENTLDALRAAGEAGFRCVQMDVALTRDNVPVLLADETLDRMTAYKGRVRARTAQELRRMTLDNGANVDTLAEAYIPTLAEALEVCAEYGMRPMLCVRTVRTALAVRQTLSDPPDGCVLISARKDVLRTCTDAHCRGCYRVDVLEDKAVRFAAAQGYALLYDATDVRNDTAAVRRAAQSATLWADNVASRSLLRQTVEAGVQQILTDCILPVADSE